MNKRRRGSFRLLWAGFVFLSVMGLCGAGAIELRHPPETLEEQTGVEATVAQNSQVQTQAQDMAVNTRVVTANTRFGFKLFSELLQQNTSQRNTGSNAAENLLISPSSVGLALAMTYNGASGPTQQAMAETLELQGISLEELNQANAALMESLETADPNVRLAIANSLWGKQDFVFNPEFLQRNRSFYGAEITTLDFSSPEAVTRINAWVNDSTGDKIPTIVEQIDSSLVLFLINAVYFQGNWTTPFDEAATIDRPFFRPDGTQKDQPMMVQQGRYRYAETEQFQAISLPYGNRRFSMYIFLPKPDSSLSDFQATLTLENWENWMNQFAARPGAIEIPRFTFESSNSLTQALQAMGMGTAFSDEADFSRLSDAPTAISEVQHKTFIEVNEAGTEAAAATSVGISVTSARPPQPPFELRVDRPFFLAIREEQTGTLLFLGSVVAP